MAWWTFPAVLQSLDNIILGEHVFKRGTILASSEYPHDFAKNLAHKHREFIIHAFDPLNVEEPFVVVRGSGATLTDTTGKKYIDFWAGNSVQICGHNHPKIVAALKTQADKLIHYTYELYTIPQVELAEKLAKINPFGMTKSLFFNGGTEAIECAYHLARKKSGRDWMVALYGGFHGRTYGSATLTSNAKYKRKMGPYLPGVTHIPSYYCYRCFLGLEYPSCGLRCAKLLEDAIRWDTDGEVAAYIAEPALGSGGNIFPPDQYFLEIKKILDEHGILFVADEIITGLGRTGKLFAMEHYGVKPDMLTLSKTLGGGLPIAALMARENVADAFAPFDYYSTFGGNPISTATSLAVLDVIFGERLVERSEKVGQYLLKALKELQDKHELIGEVQGKGLLVGVELVKDRRNKDPATEQARKLRNEALKRGLILAADKGMLGNRIRINPPLTILEEEVDRAVQIIHDSLKAITRR